MIKTHEQHERAGRPVMLESLEDRALMSATAVGFGDGSVRPAAVPAVQQTLLPAVQKVSSPQGTNGIIAILIGL